MLSACSVIYADKFIACVQNVASPMHACFESHNKCVDDVLFNAAPNVKQTLSQFVNMSNLCLVDVLLYCSPDFVVHRGLRSGLFNGHCSGEIKSGASLNCLTSTVCWSTVLLKHELIP